MKKVFFISTLIMSMLFMRAGTVQASDNTKELVQNWIDNVTSDDGENYVCHDEGEEIVSNTIQQIKDLNVTEIVSAEVKDTINDRDIILVEYDTETESNLKTIAFFYKNENNEYVICADEDIQQKIINDHTCDQCGGNGSQISSNAVVCAICSGTGQEYIPNLYYDNIMGWTGGYIGCGSCGGSGYTSGYSTCSKCYGLGIAY